MIQLYLVWDTDPDAREPVLTRIFTVKEFAIGYAKSMEKEVGRLYGITEEVVTDRFPLRTISAGNISNALTD